MHSADPSTLRPPPGFSIPTNPPPGLHTSTNLNTSAQPHRRGCRPYINGHLAYNYIGGEMQREKDASKGNND